MRPLPIADGIDWVGTLDPQLRRFDVIMQAEHGTTYNSYLVQGSEKTALIDANKAIFADTFLDTLGSFIDPAKIDYIVLNHLEPDHSGALAQLLEVAPNAVVYATKPGLNFAGNIVNREFPCVAVKDGDLLDLGDKKLRFIIAPYVHWPDTMMTYEESQGILFSCDFLGAHYCDDRMFNDLVENYEYSFHYYFQVIMRPFKEHVRYALDQIEGLDLNMVCPSHGPMLRSNVQSYLDRYRKWSVKPAPREKKKLLVFYASSYGNTEKMATEIAEGARDAGADVAVFDLVGVELHLIPDEVENAEGIAVGTCTINGDALEHTWELLASMATISIKKKVGAAFGSYGWSGEGPKMLTERMKGLKLRVPLDPLRIKLVPTDEDLAACREYGKALAAEL